MALSKNTLVVSTMKDEGPFILEWLAHHRALGFSDFLIYTNDCSDGTDLLLDRLQQNGVLTHERNEVLRRGPHKSALKYAKDHALYKNADWVFVCDVDEFLNVKIGDGKVQDLIARFPDADAIPVTWRLFSNNKHVDVYPGFCTTSFTDAEVASAENDREGRFVKSLFKPGDQVEKMGLHGPVYKEEVAGNMTWGSVGQEKNPDSDPKRPTQDFGYEVAQINHYAVRSVEAYLLKRARGRANHTKETLGTEYWNRWCRGGEEDRSILAYEKAVQREFDALIADPIVNHLHLGTLEHQRNKLKSLLEDQDFRALKAEITGTDKPAQTSSFQTAESHTLQVKAPKRHQNRVRMLEQMPKGGRCAEIGVWNGGFSGVILDVTKPSELVLIDPWDMLSDQSAGEWTHKKHQDHAEMNRMFRNVEANYGGIPQVTIRKGFSAEVLDRFPDDYFDWIYIDGNHLYDFVRKDVELGFRKVKPGGIIAGDDFFWKREGRMHVKEAVLDEMRAQGMSNRPTRIGQQFMITVQE
jgi:hypothetical protein